MKDYSVEIKVKNNYLLTQMRDRGYETAAELSRACGVSQVILGKMLNLKIAPVNKYGRVKTPVKRLIDFLCVDVEDIFPPQNILNPLKVNEAKVELNLSEIMSSNFLENKTAEQLLIADQAKSQIYAALDELKPGLRKVVEMRHGLGDYYKEHTFKEIGESMGRYHQSVRDSYAKAMRHLRNPKRNLVTYLEDEL